MKLFQKLGGLGVLASIVFCSCATSSGGSVSSGTESGKDSPSSISASSTNESTVGVYSCFHEKYAK